MNGEIAFLADTALAIVRALPVTLMLFAASAVGASAIAVLLVTASTARALRPLAAAWIFVFRGTPLLLQIFMVYYGLAALDPIRHSAAWVLFREPAFCAIVAMTCCCSAYIAEVFRAGIAAIPPGQIEAARAAGMPPLTIARLVTVPQALRLALPAYANELAMMIKSTSLASTITVIEVTGVAQQLIAHSYRTVEVFSLAAAVYLALTAGLTAAMRALERRLGPAGA